MLLVPAHTRWTHLGPHALSGVFASQFINIKLFRVGFSTNYVHAFSQPHPFFLSLAHGLVESKRALTSKHTLPRVSDRNQLDVISSLGYLRATTTAFPTLNSFRLPTATTFPAVIPFWISNFSRIQWKYFFGVESNYLVSASF